MKSLCLRSLTRPPGDKIERFCGICRSFLLKYSFRPGSEGQLLVSCFSEQITQVSTNFSSKGHSLKACSFLHLGQKIAKASDSAFCLFCNLRVSICSLRLPRMSDLNSSSILPISALLTVPDADLLSLARAGSLGPFRILDFPIERLIHNSAISGNES